MQLIEQANKHLGLRISILLHATLICVLAAMQNIRQPDVKPPQFIEVATISLKQEISGQATMLPAQTQPQLLQTPASNKSKSKPASVPVTIKRQKSKKPVVKPKSATASELRNSSVTKPASGATPSTSLPPLTNGNTPALAATQTSANSRGASGADTAGNNESVVSGKSLVVLSRSFPRYPPVAESRGIEGWVRVEVTVATDGTVSAARVVDANPKQIFDQSALDAIRRWTFKPAFKDGHAVVQRANLNMSFKIKKQR
ncbi:MAG: TonB family protein [Methylococcales bacterium]